MTDAPTRAVEWLDHPELQLLVCCDGCAGEGAVRRRELPSPWWYTNFYGQLHVWEAVLHARVRDLHRARVPGAVLARAPIREEGQHRRARRGVHQHPHHRTVRGVPAVLGERAVVVSTIGRARREVLTGARRSCVVIGFAAQWWARKHRPAWFKKYNYLTSAALDGGSQVIMFILVRRCVLAVGRGAWMLTSGVYRASPCLVRAGARWTFPTGARSLCSRYVVPFRSLTLYLQVGQPRESVRGQVCTDGQLIKVLVAGKCRVTRA